MQNSVSRAVGARGTAAAKDLGNDAPPSHDASGSNGQFEGLQEAVGDVYTVQLREVDPAVTEIDGRGPAR